MTSRALSLYAALVALTGCADLTGTSQGDLPPYVLGEAIRTHDLATLSPAQTLDLCRQYRNYLQISIPPWEEYRPWWAYAFPPRETRAGEREMRRLCRPLYDEIVARFEPDLPPSPEAGAFR